MNQLLVLKDKLKRTKKLDGKAAALYLMRLSQVQYSISDIITDFEMVRITLKGFTEEWKCFIKGIVTWEKLPNCNRLWDDFIQHEL